MGQIAHGRLNLPALLAKLATGAAGHHTDDRQDGEHDQCQLPVHPQQVAEENDRKTFADEHFDRGRLPRR